MRHQDEVQPSGIHQIAYHSDEDPSFDPLNEVTADKLWFNTTTNKLLLRNSSNTLWLPLGGS